MGVIETTCWRGLRRVLPQHVLESLDESIRAKRWQRILRRAGSEAWVAKFGRSGVGLYGPWFASEEWEDEPDAQDEHRVRSLFVAPPYWRLGGKQTSEMGRGTDRGARGQHILAGSAGCDLGQKFYERAGYIDIGGSGGRLAGHTAALRRTKNCLSRCDPTPQTARTPKANSRGILRKAAYRTRTMTCSLQVSCSTN